MKKISEKSDFYYLYQKKKIPNRPWFINFVKFKTFSFSINDIWKHIEESNLNSKKCFVLDSGRG
jgi:hypothetical protein